METLHPSEIDLGLSRIHSVAIKLNIFQPGNVKVKNIDGTEPRVITVAGTNGKGSFVRSSEAILLANNNHFGCFTSPHITKYNERIRVDGEDLSDAFICELFSAIDTARGDISLTYFEFGTLAALLAFHKLNCDYWVLEVGLGGRLDAVNIVDADIAVITSIGLDHEAWLGNSVDVIGREKAGILRAKQTAIFASKDLPQSVADVAQSLGTHCLVNGADYHIREQEGGVQIQLQDSQVVSLGSVNLPLISVAAAVQAMNAVGVDVSSLQVANSLERVVLPGRFEIVESAAFHTEFVLDVAHNEMAMELLANNINKLVSVKGFNRVVCVLGMMADKNIAASLQPLLQVVSHWDLCDIPDNPRAATGSALQACLLPLLASRKSSAEVMRHQSVADAVQKYLPEVNTPVDTLVENKTLVVVCGSFITVSHAKKLLK